MKISLKPRLNKRNKQINFSLRKKQVSKKDLSKILSMKEIIAEFKY